MAKKKTTVAKKPLKKATAPKKAAKPAKKNEAKKVKAKPAAKPTKNVAPQKANKVSAKQAIPPKPELKKATAKSKKPIKHIAIAGNIGAGKTTLVKILSKHFGWLPHFEDVENNPYLNDFYEDMPRWSFNLQVYFLNSRFRQIIEIKKGEEIVVQDRTIHEDAMIFAPNLHSMGLMSTRDYENYTRLFETITSLISPPDLMIFLKASVPTLVNQIQKRGRDYEDNLRLDYIRRLNEFYDKWIANYKDGPVLVIDVDNCNFAEEDDARAEVINKVNAELFGLF